MLFIALLTGTLKGCDLGLASFGNESPPLFNSLGSALLGMLALS